MTSWPRRPRVCLVLVALELSNDRGARSFFCRCNNIDFKNLLMLVRWMLLEQYAAVREQ